MIREKSDCTWLVSPPKQTTVNTIERIELLIKVKTRLYYRMKEMMKIAKVKKTKLEKGDSLNQIVYIKFKEEENIKKALFRIKAQEKKQN